MTTWYEAAQNETAVKALGLILRYDNMLGQWFQWNGKWEKVLHVPSDILSVIPQVTAPYKFPLTWEQAYQEIRLGRRVTCELWKHQPRITEVYMEHEQLRTSFRGVFKRAGDYVHTPEAQEAYWRVSD